MKPNEVTDLLESLLQIPSPSGEEANAVAFLVQRMSILGFECEVDAVGNAVGRIGNHGPRLALVGHIDTVPGEVPVRIEAGNLYGRGSVDAKGCLAAFIGAAVRAHRSGRLAAQVEIVACVEEEVPSSKGAHYRAKQAAPDALIIGEPSGAHAVTVGYKGFLRARLHWRENAAHSAGQASGAAAAACRQFVHLEERARTWGGARERLYDLLLVHLAEVQSHTNGMESRSELDLRLRLPEDLPPAAAVAWLEENSPNWRVHTEGGLPAWSGPRTSPLARELGRAITRCGARPRFVRKTGTADLNVLAPAWGCPAVAYGPGDSTLDHTPNEHLALAELHQAVMVLEDLLTQSVEYGAPTKTSRSASAAAASRLSSR